MTRTRPPTNSRPEPATPRVAGSARRAIPAVIAWVSVTAVATAVSAAGVSLVTSRVTDDHAVLSAGDVADLAPAEPVAPAPAPATTTIVVPPPAATTPTSVTVPPRRRSDATTTSAYAGPPRTAPHRGSDPDTATATFSNRGGVITVRCDGDAITLVGARPNDGYRLAVREDGPERVIVDFVSPQETTHLGAICMDGRPVAKDSTRTPERSTTTTTSAPLKR